MLLLVPHYATLKGQSRHLMADSLLQAAALLREVNKYQHSLALIVTKVNQVAKVPCLTLQSNSTEPNLTHFTQPNEPRVIKLRAIRPQALALAALRDWCGQAVTTGRLTGWCNKILVLPPGWG